ncbi:hypothetical protein HPB48_007075 [Haemaphysalis longicornis]|uniref:Uncharacterized protein n=1 Tax=Haemaphysalis longicornis TaxID=44386 RepID=A0A9J6G1K3_HAELO|nr:hypothetical protein HPB48_007075 [Haemaphysalis longicornis]
MSHVPPRREDEAKVACYYGERSRAALHRRERDWWPVVSCGRRALSRYGQCGVVFGAPSCVIAATAIVRLRRRSRGVAATTSAARRSLAGHPSSATRGPYLSSATVLIISAGVLVRPRPLLASEEASPPAFLVHDAAPCYGDTNQAAAPLSEGPTRCRVAFEKQGLGCGGESLSVARAARQMGVKH